MYSCFKRKAHVYLLFISGNKSDLVEVFVYVKHRWTFLDILLPRATSSVWPYRWERIEDFPLCSHHSMSMRSRPGLWLGPSPLLILNKSLVILVCLGHCQVSGSSSASTFYFVEAPYETPYKCLMTQIPDQSVTRSSVDFWKSVQMRETGPVPVANWRADSQAHLSFKMGTTLIQLVALMSDTHTPTHAYFCTAWTEYGGSLLLLNGFKIK